MGLFDFFRKKKDEKVETQLYSTQNKIRELTDEEKDVYDYLKKKKLIDEKFNQYDFINEIDSVANRIYTEKPEALKMSCFDIEYKNPEEVKEMLADAYRKKQELKIEQDLYDWLIDIEGSYVSASVRADIERFEQERLKKIEENLEKINEENKRREQEMKEFRESLIPSIIRVNEEHKKFQQRERTKALDRVYASMKRIGICDSSDEFKKLSEEEKDKLIEIQETAENIIEKKPIELSGTMFKSENEETQVKNIFLQVRFAKELMISNGESDKLYDYILSNAKEVENAYKQKEQPIEVIAAQIMANIVEEHEEEKNKRVEQEILKEINDSAEQVYIDPELQQVLQQIKAIEGQVMNNAVENTEEENRKKR